MTVPQWKERHAQVDHPQDEETIENVQRIAIENRCVTIQKIANEVEISTEPMHSILTEYLCQ